MIFPDAVDGVGEEFTIIWGDGPEAEDGAAAAGIGGIGDGEPGDLVVEVEALDLGPRDEVHIFCGEEEWVDFDADGAEDEVGVAGIEGGDPEAGEGGDDGGEAPPGVWEGRGVIVDIDPLGAEGGEGTGGAGEDEAEDDEVDGLTGAGEAEVLGIGGRVGQGGARATGGSVRTISSRGRDMGRGRGGRLRVRSRIL